jgi:hypothetical protein
MPGTANPGLANSGFHRTGALDVRDTNAGPVHVGSVNSGNVNARSGGPGLRPNSGFWTCDPGPGTCGRVTSGPEKFGLTSASAV